MFGTLHGEYNTSYICDILPNDRVFEKIDICNFDLFREVVSKNKPDVVVNAIGIIKQRDNTDDIKISVEVNSIFPKKAEKLCEQLNIRFIHFSTDCVFSGKNGNYNIHDIPDAEDVYGKTKLLGEIISDKSLTLRTSIIGLELTHKNSLIEWFLSKRGKIKGFTKAIYTGFTTLEMSRIIQMIIEDYPGISGVYQVASTSINKYDLLTILSQKLERDDVEIEPDDNFVCDRSLIATEFNSITGYTPPDWDTMLSELTEQIKQRGDVFK